MTILRPYDDYEDSESPRIGRIPSHWKMKRLRTVARLLVSNVDKLTQEGELPVRLCNYVDVYKNDHITERLPFMWVTASQAEIDRFRLRTGDVIITKDSEAWDDIGVPALVTHEAPDLLCGYHLAILRPDDHVLQGGYLHRAHQVTNVQAQYHVAANGVTRFGLTQAAIKDIVLPIPSLSEQAAIVRFLDHADQKIRRFIQAKKRLIELLNEQKQQVILRLVTKGLQTGDRLKPSNIAWAGNIPQSWDVRPVKHLTRILRGKFTHRPRNDPAFYDGPYPFIQTGEVARAKKVVDSYKQTLNEKGLAVSKLFPRGTLLMTIAANIGDVAILEIDACFPDSVVGFSPSKNMDRDYLYYLFRCMKSELLLEAPVNTQGNLNVERIGRMRIPEPPLKVQREIVEALESNISEFDLLIEVHQRELAFIREYRTRLIADVVTGKLDVREAAEGLSLSVEQEIPGDDLIGLSDLDPEEADDLDESSELLPIAADED